MPLSSSLQKSQHKAWRAVSDQPSLAPHSSSCKTSSHQPPAHIGFNTGTHTVFAAWLPYSRSSSQFPSFSCKHIPKKVLHLIYKTVDYYQLWQDDIWSVGQVLAAKRKSLQQSAENSMPDISHSETDLSARDPSGIHEKTQIIARCSARSCKTKEIKKGSPVGKD